MAPPRKRRAEKLEDPAPSTTKSPVLSAEKVFVVRVWDDGVLPPVTDFARSEFAIMRFKPGDRVFLQGWNGGAPTGRARLARLGVDFIWSVNWGWSRGAEDPAAVLASLSFKPEPDIFPVFGLASESAA